MLPSLNTTLTLQQAGCHKRSVGMDVPHERQCAARILPHARVFRNGSVQILCGGIEIGIRICHGCGQPSVVQRAVVLIFIFIFISGRIFVSGDAIRIFIVGFCITATALVLTLAAASTIDGAATATAA